MRQWMGPGSVLCNTAGAATAATGVGAVASPFLFACGALLGMGATVGESLYQQNRDKSNDPAVIAAREAEKKKKLIMYSALAAVGVLGVAVVAM